MLLDATVPPGKFAAQTLILDFVSMAERKLVAVMHEPPVSYSL